MSRFMDVMFDHNSATITRFLSQKKNEVKGKEGRQPMGIIIRPSYSPLLEGLEGGGPLEVPQEECNIESD